MRRATFIEPARRVWAAMHLRAPAQDLLHQVLHREVLQLALPAVGEQLLNMLVGIVNTFLVGHLSAAALVAVGLSTQFVMLATTLFAAVAVGSTALIARFIGARDLEAANEVLHQSMVMGTLIGVIATILGFLFAEPAIALLGAEPEALALGTLYLRIVAVSFLLSSWLFIGNACLRGAGNTRTPMNVMALVNLLNIVVAWVLINGTFGLPRLGVAGSALGTVTGQAVGGLLVLGILMQGRSGLRLGRVSFRPNIAMIRRIVHVAIPSGVEQLLMRFGQMGFARIVAGLGTVAYAAHVVALNAESLSFMPGFGFAVAATTLVGQGLGAQDPERAERSGYEAYRLGALVMSAMGILFFIAAPAFIGFFSDDPEVIRLGVAPLRLAALFQPMLAAMMIFAGALRGAGDTRWPMVVTGAGMWLIRIPLSLLGFAVLGSSLIVAWIALITDISARGLAMFWRFRSGSWKRIVV